MAVLEKRPTNEIEDAPTYRRGVHDEHEDDLGNAMGFCRHRNVTFDIGGGGYPWQSGSCHRVYWL